MRPLVMDFASDASVLDVSDQFLFGPSLMACPVYEYGARSRKVVFPQCEGWYDFYNNYFITGGALSSSRHLTKGCLCMCVPVPLSLWAK